MKQFGHTRTRVTQNHAFITPDTHVQAPLIGWEKSQAITLISPHMGARFTMYIALLEEGGQVGPAMAGVERFVFTLNGRLIFTDGNKETVMGGGWYAYLPPNAKYELRATSDSQLVVFEKIYQPLDGHEQPEAIVEHENHKQSAAFLGDEDAQLKLLLPDDPRFDMGVNLFRFKPGTPLPFVENHVMEHGLMMMQGGGVYRLDDNWYPIQQGDVIWMGSYCPQWFGALGKQDAIYLYYKDINRDPILGK